MFPSLFDLRRFVLSTACVAAVCLGASSAKADTVVYSDLGSSQGNVAEAGKAANIGGTDYTAIIADDITPAAGTGGTAVHDMVVEFANVNQTDIIFTPIVEIFANGVSQGEPGTLLYSAALPETTLPAFSIDDIDYNSAIAYFSAPSSRFWIGIIFSDQGTASLSLAELNNLGLGLENPPTAGSSLNVFFAGSGATAGGSSNPSGTVSFFGNAPAPVANFGFSLSSEIAPAPVPEPSSLSLLALGAASIGGLIGRARRKI